MAGAKHAGRIVAITTAAAVILAACSSGSKGWSGQRPRRQSSFGGDHHRCRLEAGGRRAGT